MPLACFDPGNGDIYLSDPFERGWLSNSTGPDGLESEPLRPTRAGDHCTSAMDEWPFLEDIGGCDLM